MAQLVLVEGDKFSADVYRSILEHAGHSVSLADSAQQALDILDEGGFHGVLLDVNLPGHNGIEILHELQSYRDWQSLPIIVITAVDKSRFGLSARQWRQYGVHEVLYKPRLKPAQLVHTVDHVLQPVSR